MRRFPPLLETEEPKVGDWYLIKRPHGLCEEKFIVQVVDRKEVSERALERHRKEKSNRLVPPEKKAKLDGDTNGISMIDDDNCSEREGSTPKDGSEKSQSPSGDKKFKLFYVHYDGLDRRLDEWMERECFLERALPAAMCSPAVLPRGVENASSANSGAMTRSQKRIHVEFHHQQTGFEDMDATTARLEREHEERTKVKNIQTVMMNGFEISTWYFSPFPFTTNMNVANLILYMCDFCLMYTDSEEEMRAHKSICTYRCPPGDEIYRDRNFALYEVVGKYQKTYCQALCLLSKLFLDHKTLYFDVDTFVFYILCEITESGARVMGHFSKEQASTNNLACIMILPPYQRKGYGKLLIQLSYELSYREGWIGTPEKPLSDLGKVSYRSYWWWRLISLLQSEEIEECTVAELELMSRIAYDDIVSTLQTLPLVKFWKGEHVLRITRKSVDHLMTLKVCSPPSIMLNPDKLRWIPREVRSDPSDPLTYRT